MTTDKIKDHYSDDVRLALLEQSINNINNTLVRFEKRFDQIDARFDHMDNKFTNMDVKFNNMYAKFTTMDNKFESNFNQLQAEGRSHHRWTLGLIAGLYAIFSGTLITVVIKFMHV